MYRPEIYNGIGKYGSVTIEKLAELIPKIELNSIMMRGGTLMINLRRFNLRRLDRLFHKLHHKRVSLHLRVSNQLTNYDRHALHVTRLTNTVMQHVHKETGCVLPDLGSPCVAGLAETSSYGLHGQP